MLNNAKSLTRFPNNQHWKQLMSSRNSGCWSVLHTYGPHCKKLVDFVVLAEFDIDTGSTVRHQYPHAIDGYTEDWLADHMLPEGLHNRTEDWTYIFLNRQTKSAKSAPVRNQMWCF